HHQLAAARGRRPMHAPQRLPLLVLAHAMELEAHRPAQQKAATVVRARSSVEEGPLELDEIGIDDERLILLKGELRLGQTERTGDREAHSLEAVPPAWHRGELVPARRNAPPAAAKLDVVLAEPADALPGDDARQRSCRVPRQPEVDRDVPSLD